MILSFHLVGIYCCIVLEDVFQVLPDDFINLFQEFVVSGGFIVFHISDSIFNFLLGYKDFTSLLDIFYV